MAKVTRNRAGSEALRIAMQAIAHKQVRVGFFDSAKYPDGTPVAYVATIHEFHPEHARPFMRPTIDAQRDAWRESLRSGCRAILGGQIEADAMLYQFGALVAADIKKTISALTAPPLAESTIAARRSRRKSPGVSVKPLVDTGLLIASVNNDVVDL